MVTVVVVGAAVVGLQGGRGSKVEHKKGPDKRDRSFGQICLICRLLLRVVQLLGCCSVSPAAQNLWGNQRCCWFACGGAELVQLQLSQLLLLHGRR
jgi:hypothetical protein